MQLPTPPPYDTASTKPPTYEQQRLDKPIVQAPGAAAASAAASTFSSGGSVPFAGRLPPPGHYVAPRAGQVRQQTVQSMQSGQCVVATSVGMAVRPWTPPSLPHCGVHVMDDASRWSTQLRLAQRHPMGHPPRVYGAQHRRQLCTQGHYVDTSPSKRRWLVA